MTEPMTSDVINAFNRIADELTAIHGEPFFLNREPVMRFGETYLGAGWAIDGRNHGFKVKLDQGQRIRVFAWAHDMPITYTETGCRDWTAAVTALESTVPLVFGQQLAGGQR